MQFITPTLLAILGAASALPSANLQTRDGITITFYPEPNFGGSPITFSNTPNNQCQVVPANVATGSVKVDSGALCRLTL